MSQVCEDLQVLSTDTDGHPLDRDTMRTPIGKRGTRIEGCGNLIKILIGIGIGIWVGATYAEQIRNLIQMLT